MSGEYDERPYPNKSYESIVSYEGMRTDEAMMASKWEGEEYWDAGIKEETQPKKKKKKDKKLKKAAADTAKQLFSRSP
jgi:hypothetical protein